MVNGPGQRGQQSADDISGWCGADVSKWLDADVVKADVALMKSRVTSVGAEVGTWDADAEALGSA